ncbi:MAG: hypothetical protein COB66_01955 [Coxiella sp. (in: Bacteria)]|nr:MAG: hypothetical protein COB66_01955 [Coxiella sp. (in: g-proteobacteria)]
MILKRIIFFVCCCFIAVTTLSFAAPAQKRVMLGVNQLLTHPYIAQLKGKRVAIVANNASRDSFGRRDITLLHNNPHIHLVSIFTAEHGLGVNLNNDHIGNSYDPITKLPVYSLYGHHRKPTRTELKNVDVILFDLQSVGLRYYTYISTLAKVMIMAKRYHIKVIVLDRPNPLGGNVVEGPMLDHDYIGWFTSYYDVPARYGLTIGELARYYNKFDHKHVDLDVIPMKGWHRDMLFNQTGIKWVPTSPALQTFKQTYLYSVFGTMEATNLSFGLGRAVDREYHYYGAPYITHREAHRIAHDLQKFHLPGLAFHYHSWRPVGGMYRYHWCHGIRVDVTDYNKVKSFYSLVATLEVFHRVLGHHLGLINADNMLGQRWVRRAIANNVAPVLIAKRVAAEDAVFKKKRQSILLYSN